MWNAFNVNIKDSKTNQQRRSDLFIVNFEQILRIVDIEQLNVGWKSIF